MKITPTHIPTSSASYNKGPFLLVKLFVSNNDEGLKEKYRDAIDNHNKTIHNDSFPDAGFDLFTPEQFNCSPTQVNKINFGVRTSATLYHSTREEYTCCSGFMMCPRSSLSGTPLRLANSIGIIDSGYRGDLIGKFDCLYSSNYSITKYDRLLQIVAPSMIPIIVQLVDFEQDLGVQTTRGYGGFGSTNTV
jgi:dUTP pyrophosphatase